MINEQSKVHLFVGFGGSGGKTLASFARLAAQNQQWAERADQSVFFLLCDTDEKELMESREAIQQAFEYVGCSPVIRCISLAEGIQDVAAHATRAFDTSYITETVDREAADKRIKDVWWHDKQGMPFKASFLANPPTKGAAQCPPVAAYLAWQDAGKLRDTVVDLIEEMNNRVGSGGKKLPIDVTFISSLAGGTGRGCWAILGFMIRRLLQEQGYKCWPQAYFYDQSCFKEVLEAHPEQRIKMKVNSLTGLSEVAMWVRNDSPSADPEHTIRYYLPHLKKAGDPANDVIKNIDFKGEKGKSPLNHAWIIFNKSRNGIVLETMSDYYNMVAGCLYTQVATDTSSMEQNNSPAFGSAASAVYKVPINEIRDCMKDRMVIALCDHLLKNVGDVDIPIDLLSDTDFKNLDMDDNNNGKLLEIYGEITNGFENELIEKMGEDNLRTFRKADEAFEEADNLDDGCKEDAIIKVCRGVFGEGSLAGYIKRELEAVLKNKKYSFADSNAICMKVESNLISSIDKLKEIDKDHKSNTKILDKVKEYAGRGEITHGSLKKYNDDEIDRAPNELRPLYLAASVGSLAKVLLSECKKALDSIGQHTNEFEEATEALKMQKKKFEDDIKEQEERLFTMRTDSGWSVNDEHAVALYDRTRTVERILRPVFKEDMGLVDIVLEYPLVERRIAKIRMLMLERAANQSNSAGDPEYRRDLKENLDQLKREINIEESDLQKNYSFSVVVKDLLEAWRETMKGMPSGPMRIEHERLFEQQFGIGLSKDDSNNYIVPKLDKVLIHMTLNLAKFCDSFFVLHADSESEKKGDMVMVSLPAERDVFTEKFAKKIYQDSELVKAHGLRPGAFRPAITVDDGPAGNPYMLTAFTQQSVITPDDVELGNIHDPRPLANVQSMDYWSDPSLSELLDAAECHEGTSLFIGVAGTYGLGYQDPRYVKNEDYSWHRWVPWSSNETSADKKLQDNRNDSILYSLLGNVSKDNTKSADQETISAAIRNIASECEDWTMPIVESADKFKDFSYSRLPIHNGSDGLEPDRSAKVWKVGKVGSVKDLFDEFNEEGSKSTCKCNAVLTEVKLFKSNMLGNVITTNDYNKMISALRNYLVDLKDYARKVGAYIEVKGDVRENKIVEQIESLETRLKEWP